MPFVFKDTPTSKRKMRSKTKMMGTKSAQSLLRKLDEKGRLGVTKKKRSR